MRSDLRRRLLVTGLLIATSATACGGHAQRPTLATSAADFRRDLSRGRMVGRLDIPRLEVSVLVSVGIDQTPLGEGPGWYEHSYLPGENGLTYIAGHRTTHGGPFRLLGRLRAGDRIKLELPYADAEYAVTRLARVDEKDTAILRGPRRDALRLQASTIPPSHDRLIVFAREVSLR